MSWERVRLGDVISTLKGFAFKSAHYTESGHPIVRASNFTMDSISDDDLKYYSHEDALQYEKYSLKKNDILIQTVGSWEYNPNSVVGKVVRVPGQLEGALLNQNIVKIIPNSTIDNEFLFYRLKCIDFAKYNIGNAVGAANQASITLDTIKDFHFECPDIITQKRMADILSAYDNLIENNQNQIKLLEEAAQRLYKEWFVNLRFPGYENTHIVDGIPQGWKKSTVGELGVFQRGKTITKKQVEKGDIPVVAGGLTPAYYHNMSNTEAPVITISSSGNAGYICLYHKKIWASDCSYLDKTMSSSFYFILCELKNRQNELYALQHGSAQQHVNANQINALEIIKPSEIVLSQFGKIIEPIYQKIKCLELTNESSRQARDRLLPKLMSGELEV